VEEATHILGPGGFSLRIGARALELSHVLSFWTFAGSEPERELLRRACRRIALTLGTARAIYTQELVPTGFYDGLDLLGIEAQLRAEFGEPSGSFAALAGTEHFGPHCWYVDDFSDLAA
jgi:hypothetical protein